MTVLLALSLPAQAALDEPAAAIGTEARRLGAAWQRPSLALAQPVHAMRWADGSAVRQYERPDGVVWAVAWNTRTKPRLDLLLGRHFDAYAAAARAVARPGARHTLALTAGDLVVESGMNGPSHVGRAYLASRRPAGQGSDAVR